MAFFNGAKICTLPCALGIATIFAAAILAVPLSTAVLAAMQQAANRWAVPSAQRDRRKPLAQPFSPVLS
jgi:hypothetical protein